MWRKEGGKKKGRKVKMMMTTLILWRKSAVSAKRTHTLYCQKSSSRWNYHLFLNTRFFFCLNSAT